jgi:hypothetical protein
MHTRAVAIVHREISYSHEDLALTDGVAYSEPTDRRSFPAAGGFLAEVLG